MAQPIRSSAVEIPGTRLDELSEGIYSLNFLGVRSIATNELAVGILLSPERYQQLMDRIDALEARLDETQSNLKYR